MLTYDLSEQNLWFGHRQVHGLFIRKGKKISKNNCLLVLLTLCLSPDTQCIHAVLREDQQHEPLLVRQPVEGERPPCHFPYASSVQGIFPVRWRRDCSSFWKHRRRWSAKIKIWTATRFGWGLCVLCLLVVVRFVSFINIYTLHLQLISLEYLLFYWELN